MKNTISTIIMLTIASLLISTEQSIAQDVEVGVYEQPQPIKGKRKNPMYPERQLREGIEGIVEVNLMVDENGRPFEVMASSTLGGQEFADEAIRAVSKWTFEPAKIDGKPIVGSRRTILRFQLEGGTGAHRDFVKTYKAFREVVESKPQEESKALLTQLEALRKNRYEAAFLGLSQFLYARKYGTSLEQMQALYAAMSFARDRNDEVNLSKADAQVAARELMKLQIVNHYYQEALATYHYFDMVDDKESVAAFKPVVDQLAVLENNDSAYDIPIELDKDGHFEIGLFKHKVYATAIEGKLVEFKLFCEKKFVGFPVEADVVYDIPKQWGICTVDIVGDAGTKFKLTQQ